VTVAQERVRQGLPLRARILVAAGASAFGDSYCSLAWGGKLATKTGADIAAAVIAGDDSGLEPAERPLAAWARAVAGDPNATHAAQVAALRAAGYADADIFAMTVFVALRVALSTVNDALGIAPDTELAAGLPRTYAEPSRSAGRPTTAAPRPPPLHPDEVRDRDDAEHRARSALTAEEVAHAYRTATGTSWDDAVRHGLKPGADAQPSTPVVACALPTGLDCDEPRWRR
jgi:hypothetical protein